MKITGTKWIVAAGALIVIALILRLAVFTGSVLHIPASADEAITMLQAKGIVEPATEPTMNAKQYPRGVNGRFPLLFMAEPYLFPLESYLTAPFMRILPRTDFGARLVPALMGLLSVVVGLLIVRRIGSWETTWPGALLILVPSAYWLTLQVAHGLPGYPSFMLLFMLAIWLAMSAGERDDARVGRALLHAILAGFAGGLACSVNLMALPVLGMAGLLMVNSGARRLPAMLAAFGIGAVVGLGPYFYAKSLFPDAFAAVSDLVPPGRALQMAWNPGLTYTLPSALGIQPCHFPDTRETAAFFPATAWFGIVWLVLVGASLATGLLVAWRTLREKRCLALNTGLVFAGISILALALFALNRRSHAVNYRYLLAAVLALPFILAWLYQGSGPWLRRILGTFSVLLAIMNIAYTVVLIREWAKPGFADRLKLYDLSPAVEYLDQRQIRACYASYFDAYRINFMTDERIMAAQPFNERFPHWPLPYKEIVDAASPVAYVLADGWRYKARQFEDSLRVMNVDCLVTTCGAYSVFTDFKLSNTVQDVRVDRRLLTVACASNQPATAILTDGKRLSRWQSRTFQERGMMFEIRLGRSMDVTRVACYYDGYARDMPRSLTLSAMRDGIWKAVAADVPRALDRFEFHHNHPVMGSECQSISFPSLRTDRLRIEIADPEPARAWTLGEIEVYSKVERP